jgi:hypothetical protein
MNRGSRALFAIAIALGMAACPKEPDTPDGGVTPPVPTAASGAWKATTSAKAAEGCTQKWTCDCSAMQNRVGCKIEGTADDATLGACAAESGPHLACTRCLALPPAVPCACKLVCP